MIKLFLKYISLILFKLYGYEALNILLKNIPSKNINLILKLFGANIGENVRIKSPLIIHNADENEKIYMNLTIGDNVYIGRDCIFDIKDKITIENNVTISHRAVFNTHIDLGNSNNLKKKYYPTLTGKIKIKNGSYIGSNVTILQNVTIGSNSLIGSFSLVNKDIKSGYRAFGVPCRKNKRLI